MSVCMTTQRFTSNVGTLQRSEQHKYSGVSFAGKRLAVQVCIFKSNRRGCCVVLVPEVCRLSVALLPFTHSLLFVHVQLRVHHVALLLYNVIPWYCVQRLVVCVENTIIRISWCF